MWERIKSNIRFSLSLRIALRYALFLAGSFFGVLLAFTAAYLLSIAPHYIQEGQVLTAQLEQPEFHNPWTDLDVKATDAQDRVVYDDTQGAPLLFSGSQRGLRLGVRVYSNGYTFTFVAYLAAYVRQYLILAGTLTGLELIRIGSMVRKRKRLARSVLRPIDEMAAAAEALSGSNLDLRINVNGTKNELRDLAAVINDMLDRLESAYESQKAFVSDASHELRTPIAVIQGYARMLERWGMEDPEVAKEAVGAIAGESESMRDLVEKLLFLARHDKKTFRLEKEWFDGAELCRELIRDTRLIDPGHCICEGELAGVNLYGDRSAVKQALRVFVENAQKYTPQGGTIRIGCEERGDVVSLSVTDTGQGMTKEEAKKAFNRFYRAESARAAGIPGHGLGLSMARLIAGSHGGKIAVKTAPGQGSTFRLLLPRSEPKRPGQG